MVYTFVTSLGVAKDLENMEKKLVCKDISSLDERGEFYREIFALETLVDHGLGVCNQCGVRIVKGVLCDECEAEYARWEGG